VSEQEVLFEQKGALALITLNRPKALNALTPGMCLAIHARLQRWAADASVKAVAIGGAERAFCAGGDIRALYEGGRAERPTTIDFYRDEYRLNAAIKHFPKPFVAFLHGVVMGGGVGVSVHGSHRVADASVVFAMPETGIGLFPDVGASFFLPRLPGAIGMYVALTGARLKLADVMYAGIATHCVPMARWESVIDRLANGEHPDFALSRAAQTDVGAPPLAEHRETIDGCFSEDSVESILAALDALGSEWSAVNAASMRIKSPTSLKISSREMRDGASLAFDDCMRMEFRMVNRVMAGHDFYEGVRATIIDKDGAARWQPATLAEVTESDVDAYFAPLQDELPL
jgi:enoyl-CoA hydratase